MSVSTYCIVRIAGIINSANGFIIFNFACPGQQTAGAADKIHSSEKTGRTDHLTNAKKQKAGSRNNNGIFFLAISHEKLFFFYCLLNIIKTDIPVILSAAFCGIGQVAFAVL
jgi:hypothetical protein